MQTDKYQCVWWTDNPVRKGTIVGTFVPVDEVKVETERRCRKSSGKELQEQLQILLQSAKHLGRAQKSKLKATLNNNQDVFALKMMIWGKQKLWNIK